MEASVGAGSTVSTTATSEEFAALVSTGELPSIGEGAWGTSFAEGEMDGLIWEIASFGANAFSLDDQKLNPNTPVISNSKKSIVALKGGLFFRIELRGTSLPVTADKMLMEFPGVSAAAISPNKEGGPLSAAPLL